MDDKKRAFQFALITVLVLRLATSLILAVAADAAPVTGCLYTYCDPQVNAELNQSWFGKHFLAPWYRWDTAHYLDKADPDYQILGLENTVWPPLYPLLIRIFSVAMPGMAAALLISTLSSLAAFYLLYRELSVRWDEAAARRTVLLLAFFPTGFFLMAGYTEALFLALSLAVFTEIRRKRWWMAGVWGALATLTRLQGVFLVLPLVWEGFCMLRDRLAGKGIKELLPVCRKDREIRSLVGAAVLITVTLAGYFCITHFVMGAPWPWQLQTMYWQHRYGWPWEGLVNFLTFILKRDYPAINVSMFLDAFLLLLLAAILTYKWKELPFSYILYSAVMLVFPTILLTGVSFTMVSISRYLLAVFPAFIALALTLQRRPLYLAWLGLFMVSQFVLLFYFYQWMWVA